VREPLMTWMQERWHDHRVFRYHLGGTDRKNLKVTRK
jgi:hypothetical protein